MSYFLIVVILLILIVFKKYSIDTKMTINGVKKDRDAFRHRLWNLMEVLSKSQRQNDVAYQNVKSRINILIKDLEETDFKKFDGDIKMEVINALKDIDFYGDKDDNTN